MRIVALSDQHGFLPEIPPCDLVIVAGDVCPDRFGPFMALHHPHQQQAWFDRKVRPWLAAAPATHKLLTWGNHDWCGQACSFRADSSARSRSTNLQNLVDEATTIPCSGRTSGHMSIWATPWSNRFMRWAFMKTPSELDPIYAAIPEGIDILVSHQPPLYHGDRTFSLETLAASNTSEAASCSPRSNECDHGSSFVDMFTRASAAMSTREYRSTTSVLSMKPTGSSTWPRSSTCRTPETPAIHVQGAMQTPALPSREHRSNNAIGLAPSSVTVPAIPLG